MKNDDIPTVELAPELAALLHHQHEIDYAEAGPKAPVNGFAYRSIQIDSRWAVLAELETIKRIVDALPELMGRRIESIWCDSKCGSNYIIRVRQGRWVPNLNQAVSNAVMSASGGHNGIAIEEGQVRRADIAPDWNEL